MSNFSLKDDWARIRSMEHDNRLESSPQMSRSSIWMGLTGGEATGKVCERTPLPSVAATLETDHSWLGMTFLPGTD
ncbi:hypothetical protein ANCCAN_29517 [Ancylostoma caninum]|uniref:Uncharacterized protein n=1 Tax=Ancylostoma caninum TaxID=29170 RepID=A0A368F1A1_ANCCA|nr:hypothetical protein ANCCAN_29517 [Ancylostoma caninum]